MTTSSSNNNNITAETTTTTINTATNCRWQCRWNMLLVAVVMTTIMLPKGIDSSMDATTNVSFQSIKKTTFAGIPNIQSITRVQQQHQHQQQHQQTRDFLRQSLERVLNPLDITEECRTDTEDLANFPGIADATVTYVQWAEEISLEDICTYPTDTKTSCVFDYEDSLHTLKNACAEVGGLYVRTSYILRCNPVVGNSVDSSTQMFWQADNLPACVALSCGADGARALQDETVRDVETVFLEEAGRQCQRMRFVVDDPIIPEFIPSTCQDDTVIIMDSLTDITDPIETSVLGDDFATYCSVPNAAGVECQIDWFPLYNTENDGTQHSLDNACQNLESTTGLYVEVDATMECIKDNTVATHVPNYAGVGTIQLQSIRQPLCISGVLCQYKDLQTEAESQIARFVSQMEGWACTTSSVTLEDFVASSMPTVSNMPSASISPSATPSFSPAPTSSIQPSSSPTVKSCLESSKLFNQTDTIQQHLIANQQAIDSQSFTSYCTYPVDSTVKPYIVTCGLDYSNLAGNSEIQNTCENTLTDSMYVEDTVTMICYENKGTDDEKETHIEFINRPNCRSTNCNGKQLQDMAEYGLNWFTTYYEANNENTVCDFDSIKVLLGGANDPSNQVVDEISSSCLAETNSLSTVQAIFNWNLWQQQQVKDYLAVDNFRAICSGPRPKELDCDIDYETKNFNTNSNGMVLDMICANALSGGQYVESEFLTSCYDPEEDLQFYFNNYNVPSCIGTTCNPGEGRLYMQEEDGHGWMADYYESLGWECDTIVTNFFAPNYDASAANNNNAPVPTPVAAPVTAPSSSTNTDDELYPTTGNVPQFGAIFLTQSPTSESERSFPPEDDGQGEDTNKNNNENDKEKGKAGKIVGIIFGVLIGLCLCCACLYYLLVVMKQDDDGEYDENGEKYDDVHGDDYYNDPEDPSSGEYDDDDEYGEEEDDDDDDGEYDSDEEEDSDEYGDEDDEEDDWDEDDDDEDDWDEDDDDDDDEDDWDDEDDDDYDEQFDNHRRY